DPARAEATLARLRESAPAAAHRVHYADLSRIAEMKRVAAEIAAAEPRIHLLINNAGALFGTRRLTEDGLQRSFAVNHMAYFLMTNAGAVFGTRGRCEDGLELAFAVNHMAYFVLTAALREGLIAAAPARVVNTASTMHRVAWLDFNDLQYARFYSGLLAYGRSK